MPGIFNTQAEMLKGGDDLVAALSTNTADLGHLEVSRDKLVALLAQLREELGQQSIFTASKQEKSRQIERLFRNGSKLITFLRKGVAEHYGTENEKLVEFGIQPFRPKARRRAAAPAGAGTLPPAE